MANDPERFIVLLRHGVAEPRGDGTPEEERRLTDTGNQRMKQIRKALARIVPNAERIYSSPLVRCVETSEWVASAYDRPLAVVRTEALKPSSNISDFQELLKSADARCAFFVGHEPSLSGIMLGLTGMQSAGGLELTKGGCYGIAIDDSGARLLWMLTSRILRDGW